MNKQIFNIFLFIFLNCTSAQARTVSCIDEYKASKIEFNVINDEKLNEEATQFGIKDGQWQQYLTLKCHNPTVEKNLVGYCTHAFGPDAGRAAFLEKSKKGYIAYYSDRGPDGKDNGKINLICSEN